MLMIISWL